MGRPGPGALESFTHSTNTECLQVPGTVLEAGERAVDETRPCLHGAHVLEGKETENQINELCVGTWVVIMQGTAEQRRKVRSAGAGWRL